MREAATNNGWRYVDWPLRRHHEHRPSLRGKRNGQLPGPAEKIAVVSEAVAVATARHQNVLPNPSTSPIHKFKTTRRQSQRETKCAQIKRKANAHSIDLHQ